MTNQKITIIVPVFNEAANLAPMAEALKKTTARLPFDFEIIFVNDGSTDQSPSILKNIPDIKVLHHPYNLGYGAAIKTGLKQAGADWILIIDADGTYEAADIPKLLENFEDYDMVVGARTSAKVKIPLARRPIKWFFGWLANFLAKTKIPDLNSGLRLFKKERCLEFLKILPDGFSFTSTITLALLTNNYPVKFVPINYHKRQGRSKIRPVYDAYNFLTLIIRTVLYFNPLRIFLPLAGLLLLIALGFFIYSFCFTPKIMDATVAIFFTAAIQVAVIGLLADLIDKRGLS